ncbi:MAG: YgiQ family radical SAM protein [Proteobacteria bacterium]|nr:YgiQ family radical SAM protein [Pseudomonadota bacterium]MBU4297205.1 YgiQ family radical SAM protein [Pseudomonadota bacterium]MCG2748513.1 YgiQ family radical SAM protein [Desulfobulbaceae bacterium]
MTSKKNKEKSDSFLPTNAAEMRLRGWDEVDIILVTGDAYVDHPAFGVALIGRLLEASGFRVAILSQPRYDSPQAFKQFGPPRLFWGITAGNLDSIVANYSGNAKVRDVDQYSPGGNPYFGELRTKSERRRPDRATIRYANLARNAYGTIPIILGGLEASLRRFVHYDYQQGKLRASVLTDAKADLLVYGMGERAVVEAAKRLAVGRDLAGIAGTCQRLTDAQQQSIAGEGHAFLPSLAEIEQDREAYLSAELLIDRHARSLSRDILLQKQQAMWVVQHPPAEPLSTAEMDSLYGLPFTRKTHPAAGDVPAYRMICHSVTIVRGCFGNCSFCAISRHQGPVITSRSEDSVVAEVGQITRMDDFRGTISDLGGPTANLYGTGCRSKACSRHDCLHEGVCRHLAIDEGPLISLLDRVRHIDKVKNVFVSSGLRMELLLKTPRLLKKLLTDHTPGAMKIAPEHTVAQVLRLMHKHGPDILPAFLALCRKIAGETGKEFIFTPYFISAHPGCSLDDMKSLARDVRKMGLTVRQFQDFTPTPGTISTAMYVCGLDRYNHKPIYVAYNAKERMQQRHVLAEMK